VLKPHDQDFILYLATQGKKGNQLSLPFLLATPLLAEASFTAAGATITAQARKFRNNLVWL